VGDAPGKAGPLRGQQTRSILRELAYTDAQVEELKAERVVDWEAV
jgi:crotonobetainyl-CoA:carnitine CoA-transferase CaiB-like acyl-CoA transferase